MTYQEWKETHHEEIDTELRKLSDVVLRHLYNAFSDDIYQDGVRDGYEQGREHHTTEERFLDEREEEL